jgi:PKD repeat protein
MVLVSAAGMTGLSCDAGELLAPEPGNPAFLAASAAAVTLVGAGDIATCNNPGGQQTADLVKGVLATAPNVTVFTAGDNAYPNGSAAEYQNCYGPTWGQFKSRTRPAIGNHEYNTDNANPTFDYFNGSGATDGPAGKRGQGYYSYDIGSWHVVVLNMNSSFVSTSAGSPQEVWLKADLAATGQPCVLAIWHHARFFSGTTSPLPAPSGYHLDIWKDLYAAGADLVLNGHIHVYERYAPQTPTGGLDMTKGLRQLTVGTGGASGGTITVLRRNVEVVNGQTRGVIKLTLDNGWYSWEFLPVAGKTFTDRGAGICHGSPEPAGNLAPTISFNQSCTGLACNFSDTSTDPDGKVEEWGWSFGDGETSVARNPGRTYAQAGTYTVRLTGRDNSGVMRTTSKQITVAPIASSEVPPVLKVTARSDATTQYMTLDWTGVTGTTVDVYRNGVLLTNTPNDGHYVNSRAFTGAATYVYRVCQTGTSRCSNSATAVFG